jgi:hypothetical protein
LCESFFGTLVVTGLPSAFICAAYSGWVIQWVGGARSSGDLCENKVPPLIGNLSPLFFVKKTTNIKERIIKALNQKKEVGCF